MSKSITISENTYRILKENAQDKGISLDALAEELIYKSIGKRSSSWYQSFREKMLKENPELKNRTSNSISKEFEILSDKIAQGIHFESLEDMERFMRREELDPRRL